MFLILFYTTFTRPDLVGHRSHFTGPWWDGNRVGTKHVIKCCRAGSCGFLAGLFRAYFFRAGYSNSGNKSKNFVFQVCFKVNKILVKHVQFALFVDPRCLPKTVWCWIFEFCCRNWTFWILKMLLRDYHLQYTFGYQILLRALSSGIETVPKYWVVLGFLKQARAGLGVENQDPVPTLDGNKVNSLVKETTRIHKWSTHWVLVSTSRMPQFLALWFLADVSGKCFLTSFARVFQCWRKSNCIQDNYRDEWSKIFRCWWAETEWNLYLIYLYLLYGKAWVT